MSIRREHPRGGCLLSAVIPLRRKQHLKINAFFYYYYGEVCYHVCLCKWRQRVLSSVVLHDCRCGYPSVCATLQGSAKLEKAEILQMTVDHLKLLHQKGIVASLSLTGIQVLSN